jgi:hypothetical protein
MNRNIHQDRKRSRAEREVASPASEERIHMYTEYYQIFENGKPLIGLIFLTKKEATSYLRSIPIELERLSTTLGWYKVEQRLPHLPTLSILGIRKTYADNTIEDITYTIKHVTLQPVYR